MFSLKTVTVCYEQCGDLTFKALEIKMHVFEFVNSMDADESADKRPPHLGLVEFSL